MQTMHDNELAWAIRYSGNKMLESFGGFVVRIETETRPIPSKVFTTTEKDWWDRSVQSYYLFWTRNVLRNGRVRWCFAWTDGASNIKRCKPLKSLLQERWREMQTCSPRPALPRAWYEDNAFCLRRLCHEQWRLSVPGTLCDCYPRTYIARSISYCLETRWIPGELFEPSLVNLCTWDHMSNEEMIDSIVNWKLCLLSFRIQVYAKRQ